jgi:hypothetical protein
VFCRQARTRSCSSIPPGRALRVSVFTSALSTVVLRGGPARWSCAVVLRGQARYRSCPARGPSAGPWHGPKDARGRPTALLRRRGGAKDREISGEPNGVIFGAT